MIFRTDRWKGLGALRGPGAPSLLFAEGGDPSVLAFHGFGGTPLEVELLVDAARTVGLRARAPLLPGHGTHARKLAKFGFGDWQEAARQALAELSGAGEVIAAGSSLGSLLALDLALHQPQRIAGLILIANALWLNSPYPALPLRLARRLRLPDFLIPKWSSNLGDPSGQAQHVSYTALPLHATLQVLSAAERLRGRLSEVRCPTLILHGAADRVCPVSNAWRAGRLLSSKEVRVVVFPRSRHILTWDFERAAVRSEVERFLEARRLSQCPVEP